MLAFTRLAAICLVALLLQTSKSKSYPIKNYELMRPLQYFFYLLELKAQFNPMLGAINNAGTDCSSKIGPFCRITGHQPFQTHVMKAQAMPKEIQPVYLALVAEQKHSYQTYQNFVRHSPDIFLIRYDLVNQYQEALKKAIGDRNHLAEILPAAHFENVY